MIHRGLIRPALRLYDAHQLHNRIAHYQRITDAIREVEPQWSSIQRQLQQIQAATQRGWNFALRRGIATGRIGRDDFVLTFRDMCKTLTEYQSPAESHCTPWTLYDDLAAINDEFPRLEWNRKELLVTTESIVLEDVALGSFTIRLPYDSLGRAAGEQIYYISAVDPNPSCGREQVVHPHVDNERLCAGDATVPIGNALSQGRILDFFMIVRSVLKTYSPGSAYARLDNWEEPQKSCEDCGNSLEEEDLDYCRRCHESLCGECSYGCDQCGCSLCLDCSVRCAVCENRSCKSGCTRVCPMCSQKICRGCADSEGVCESCQEDQEPQDPLNKGGLFHETQGTDASTDTAARAAQAEPAYAPTAADAA